jgi:hypothetical protein
MTAETPATGSIADRGYQHYAGRRLGLGYALWTMVKASLQRGMGIKRPFRTKIMPWLLVIVTYIPIVVLLAIRILVRGHNDFAPTAATFAGFYSGIALSLILFAGLVGPDLLCPDRRERVLSLYFVAPITRVHYLFSRFGALVALLMLMSLVPALLFFAGSASLSSDALGFAGSHFGDLAHIFLAGVLVSAYYGAVAVAVAAFNDRRAYAVGTYVGLLLVSGIAGGVVSNHLHFLHHEWFALTDLSILPLQAMAWMFGQSTGVDLSGWVFLVASLAVIALSGMLAVWQYRRLSAL